MDICLDLTVKKKRGNTMKRIVYSILALSILALAGCGNVESDSKAEKSENTNVGTNKSADKVEVDETQNNEFRLFHSSNPDEKTNVTDEDIKTFSEYYENVCDTWEMISESSANEITDSYGGLYYVIEECDNGSVVSEMYLMSNVDADNDNDDYSEVMLFDKRSDTVRRMKCSSDSYNELYKMVAEKF